MELLLTVADYSDDEIRRVEDTVTKLESSTLKSLGNKFRIVDTNGTECAVVIKHTFPPRAKTLGDSYWIGSDVETRVLWGYTVEDRTEWKKYLDGVTTESWYLSPQYKNTSDPRTKKVLYKNRFDSFGSDRTPIIRQGTFMRMYVKGDVVTFDGVTTKPATILDHTDTHITLKHQGQSYWAARGIQGYAPAEIKVYDTTQAHHRITKQGNVSYAGNFPVKASWVVKTSDPRHEDCRACKNLQS